MADDSKSRLAHLRSILPKEQVAAFDERYTEYLKELEQNEAQMEILYNIDYNKCAEAITFEQLSEITFVKAQLMIDNMSMGKRVRIFTKLNYRLEHLYEGTKGYNDQGFGKSLPPKQFYTIMGKIKHMETLKQWLFGLHLEK